MQVLGHVSQRIADLHAAGYVHRDLKPGNIMWQPRTYTWVLIDFGLTARAGEGAAVGCTPGYAAPETVLACLQGARRVTADHKVDSWALGVIAFELLLQRPAFGMFQGVNDVRLLKPSCIPLYACDAPCSAAGWVLCFIEAASRQVWRLLWGCRAWPCCCQDF